MARRHITLGILLASALCAMIVASIARAEISPLGVVAGFVRTEEGVAVRGVPLMVYAYREGAWREGTFNQDTGTYAITLPSGDWYLNIEARPATGFTSLAASVPVNVASGAATLRDLVLKRLAGTITGTVRQPDGTAVTNAVVQVADASARVFFSADVDAHGSFHIAVPTGEYSVWALPPPQSGVVGGEAVHVFVRNGSASNVGLVFEYPVHRISGTVTLSGEVVPRASVRAWSDAGGYVETYADQDGWYDIRVNDGLWHVSAVSSGDGGTTVSDEKQVIVAQRDATVRLSILPAETVFPLPKTVNVSRDRQVSIQLDDGMKFSIVAGALPVSEATLTVAPFIAPAQRGVAPSGPAYQLTLRDVDGRPIEMLSKNAIIEIPYVGASLADGEHRARVILWDSKRAAWIVDGTAVVDGARGKIVGTTKYLATYIVTVPQPLTSPSPTPLSSPSPLPTPSPTPSPPEESSQPSPTPTVSPTPPVTSPTPPAATPTLAPSPRQPASPSNLSLKDRTQEDITIQWEDVNDETGYLVERSVNDGEFIVIVAVPENTVSFSDYDITPSASYKYRIAAVNNIGSAVSQELSVEALLDTQAPVVSNFETSVDKVAGTVTVEFTTDEPANSIVACAGISDSVQPNQVYLHSHTIAVVAGREYKCSLAVLDATGNGTEQAFTVTRPAAPRPVEVRPEPAFSPRRLSKPSPVVSLSPEPTATIESSPSVLTPTPTLTPESSRRGFISKFFLRIADVIRTIVNAVF